MTQKSDKPFGKILDRWSTGQTLAFAGLFPLILIMLQNRGGSHMAYGAIELFLYCMVSAILAIGVVETYNLARKGPFRDPDWREIFRPVDIRAKLLHIVFLIFLTIISLWIIVSVAEWAYRFGRYMGHSGG